MTEENPPAILLGGSSNAVSVARSLGRAGVRVHVLGRGGWDPVRHSRHCASFAAPRRADVQAAWLDLLESMSAPGGVLLPCDDEGLELVARNRAALVARGFIPIEADDRVLLDTLDKERTYELARGIGVPAPRTERLVAGGELRAAEAIGFPCALKPVRSHEWARRVPLGKAVVVHDAAELEGAILRLDGLGVELLVTEIVPGLDDQLWSYFAYLDERGDLLLEFVKRKLRQYLPHFGVGCYHVSAWDPDVARVGLEFLRGIGLRGLAYVELKRDSRDGTLKLIECNHRFPAGNELPRVAGIDLALFTYARLTGGEAPPVDSYRRGVYLWHPADDVRAFLAYRKSGELSFARWAGSLLHRQHFPVFSWSDPAPTLAYCLRALGRRRTAHPSIEG